jgi:hypothetical protein
MWRARAGLFSLYRTSTCSQAAPTGVTTCHHRTIWSSDKNPNRITSLLPRFTWPLPESVSKKYCASSTTHAIWPTPWKSEMAKEASNKEPAPRCHRVTHQVGCQKATSEHLRGSKLLSHLRLPNVHLSPNISPWRC